LAVKKILYLGRYPSAARYLMAEGVTNLPRQHSRTFQKYTGIDIVYTLHGLTPVNFERYADSLLLLAYQEATRYKDTKWKFAGFDVRLGRLKKGKDLPETNTFQCAMATDPDTMVYGPGYEVPQRHFLYHKVEDILDIVNRYPTKVSKQKPYRVMRLFISIREDIR